MKQMVCSICSCTYDEGKGIPEAGIAPGTKWEDLPEVGIVLPFQGGVGTGGKHPETAGAK